MTPNQSPCALIAEDEPLLAAGLVADLRRAWPALNVVATVGDGASAVDMALAHTPDVLFLDIRMPGQTGLDAAAELADAWDTQGPHGKPFPAIVFVTAYDQYAVQAFETQAVDYLLKPVKMDRLEKTVAKLQSVLVNRAQDFGRQTDSISTATALERLGRAIDSAGKGDEVSVAPVARLKMIPASVGTAIRMVPIDEVIYFEAADKYIRVLTAQREYLIRTPLKELLPQLGPDEFWQIHRGTVVRSSTIDVLTRDEAGKLSLNVRGRAEKLAVSRLYAHLFKAM